MTTISEIREANRRAGGFFFERDTMRFFRSKVLPRVYEGKGGIYFITSEQSVGSDGQVAPRKHTIRRFFPESGSIKTVGEFNRLSREYAKELARKLANGI